jgi:hypothetical protein
VVTTLSWLKGEWDVSEVSKFCECFMLNQ